jgi:hypothetical protein
MFVRNCFIAAALQANPPSSNSWVAMTPDPVPEQPASVPMTAADERHMKEVGTARCRRNRVDTMWYQLIIDLAGHHHQM